MPASKTKTSAPGKRQAPTVSIGLPVFNGDEFLEDTLDSLLDQTFEDFELIICDNASTDTTEQICRRFAALDPRIRYHRQPKNLGACANYDMTFHKSRGKYFKWAAHDDLVAPTFLQRLVDVLDRDPTCVLVHSRSFRTNRDGSPNMCFLDQIDSPSNAPSQRLAGWLIPQMRNYSPTFGLIRRGVMAKTALHGNYLAADLVFLAAMTLQGKCRIVPELLFFNRGHPANSVRAHPDKRDLHAWFRGSKPRLPVVQHWRLLMGFLGAARRAKMSLRQRVKVHLVLLQWMSLNRRILGLELMLPLYLNGRYTRLGRRLFGDDADRPKSVGSSPLA